MYSIIVSEQDIAGMNMRKIFIEDYGFKESERDFKGKKIFELENKGKKFELVTLKEEQIYADSVKDIETDLLIFASRHSSKAEVKSLTVHCTGNWGKAVYGGEASKLSIASSVIHKNYLLGLKEEKEKNETLKDYDVSLEVTHHGPTPEKPVVFIETGGTEKEWNDLNACKAIAETIMKRTSFSSEHEVKTAIGIGGNHYGANFTKIMLNSEYSFSHMCPKYALPSFNKEMLLQAIEKTKEKVNAIIFDHKGLNEKARIKGVAEEIASEKGIEVLSSKHIGKD